MLHVHLSVGWSVSSTEVTSRECDMIKTMKISAVLVCHQIKDERTALEGNHTHIQTLYTYVSMCGESGHPFSLK